MSSSERAAFAGQITDLPVGELFRTVVHGKQTGLARFETNLGSATIWFRDGSIIDADMGRFHMGAAVRRLLTADTGSFEIEFKPVSRKRLIKEETQTLLDSVDDADSGPMTKSGPSRIRRAPVGWTPTAGGRAKAGTTPDAAPAPPAEVKTTRRHGTGAQPSAAQPLLDSQRLRAVAKTPDSDEVLRYDAPPEDENLTRVARIPKLVRDPLPKPPMLDLDPVGEAESGETSTPSASATTLGYPAHAASRRETPSTGAAAVAPPGRPRREGSFGGGRVASPDPPASAAPFAPPPRPPETDENTIMRPAPVGQRPRATAKTPVHEPGPGRSERRPTVADGGSPEAIVAEEGSDPIPIGTTWAAPSHLSEPIPVKPDPAAARGASAGGEIGRSGGGSKSRTLLAFSPPAPAQADQDPGGTVTHGFRPISAAEAKAKLRTDSFPAVRTGKTQAPRTAEIEAAVGIAPSLPPPAAATAPTDTNAPAVVGRYEVLLRIARGGMGMVYLCRVTGAGGFRRLFALKVIRDHLSRNEEYVTMLLQEARIASRLHHPNVVGIVDIGTLANQHYLVMDYVEGCTFSELMKVHRKSRPPQLVIPIVLDALTGLHAAHSLVNDDGAPLTLVHCDFSPQNMLVGTNGICRITDFGIAKASNALPERSSITRGKPAYLSPEQVMGRSFDHRADIFAAGVVLWNALTGEQLFGGDTPEEILERVLKRPIQPPSTVGLRPPRSLDKVVLRALQRDPDARYQTAEEMLIELRRVAITEDLLAPSSDVARWVADTFGTQLELRRQAAGISSKSSSAIAVRESREVAVPELGLGSDASATHAVVHTGSDTHPNDGESRTVMLPTPVASENGLGKRQRAIIFGLAGTMAAAALTIAFVRPGWIHGGFLDEDGTYFEPSAPVVLPKDDSKKAKTSASGAGADEAGADEAGADGAGADEAGADGAGADEAGADEAGADEAGADDAPAAEAGAGEADAAGADDAAAPEPAAGDAGVAGDHATTAAVGDAPAKTEPAGDTAPPPTRPKPVKPKPTKPKPPAGKPAPAETPAKDTPPAETPASKPKPKPDPDAGKPALPKPPDFGKIFGDDKVPG